MSRASLGLVSLLVVLGLVVALVGCSSSTRSKEPVGPLETETRVDVTLTNDAGQPVESFPVGGAAFAGLKGLAARQLYDVLVYANEKGEGTPVGGGTFTSDGSGVIPPTLLVRELGTTDGLPKGKYAVVVRKKDGEEVARESFEVVDNEDPICYACTPEGGRKSAFLLDKDPVWVTVENLQANAEGEVYVMPAKPKLTAGEQLDKSLGVRYVQADAEGKAVVELWPNAANLGAYDLVLDLNNNGKWDEGTDVLNGYTLAAFVVQKEPLAPDEEDLVVNLAGGVNIAEAGAAAQIGSDQDLYVRGVPETIGQKVPPPGSIYVVPHQDKWENEAPLMDRSKTVERSLAISRLGIERTLVWPKPILPGAYDIVIDVDEDKQYTRGVDLIDNVGSTPAGGGEAGIVIVAADNLISVFGKVVDKDGKPVEGATVSCDDAVDSPQTTNSEGKYEFKQVLPLPTTIVATKGGYSRGEIQVSLDYSKKPVEVRDVALGPVGPTGTTYYPIAAGNEWTYTVDRSYKSVTSMGGSSVTVGPYEERGHVVRSVGDPDEETLAGVKLWPLHEEETVFLTAPTPDETGEQVRERTFSLEVGAQELRFHDVVAKASKPFLPTTLSPGVTWEGAEFHVGEYTLIVNGKVSEKGSIEVGAGEFANALVVELTPVSIRGPDAQTDSVQGTIKVWLAQDVGEIRREVDITADLSRPAGQSGESVLGSFAITEKLELVSYETGFGEPTEQPAQAATPRAQPSTPEAQPAKAETPKPAEGSSTG